MESIHSLGRKVGIGLREDDLTGAAMTVRHTSSVVTSFQIISTGRWELPDNVNPTWSLHKPPTVAVAGPDVADRICWTLESKKFWIVGRVLHLRCRESEFAASMHYIVHWLPQMTCIVTWSEVQTCLWPSWCHCYSLSLASVKSRLVLPFWYRLTRVVPEKGPLNVCVHGSGVNHVRPGVHERTFGNWGGFLQVSCPSCRPAISFIAPMGTLCTDTS